MKKKSKNLYSKKNMTPVDQVDRRTEEQKQIERDILNFVKWRKWTLLFIVLGFLAGIFGQQFNQPIVSYSGIGLWMIGAWCHYQYNKERNDYIIAKELKKKEEKDAAKAVKK